MEYDDPPEWRGRAPDPPTWQGRSPRSREGWPTNGGGGLPGSPRGHRLPDEYADDQSPGGFPEDMPTDPIGPDRVRRAQQFAAGRSAGHQPIEPGSGTRRLDRWQAPAEPVVHVIDRDPEGLPRMALWFAIVRDMAIIAACLGSLWVVGTFISHGGVPLWVPK